MFHQPGRSKQRQVERSFDRLFSPLATLHLRVFDRPVCRSRAARMSERLYDKGRIVAQANWPTYRA
jgi:hypothetical protein